MYKFAYLSVLVQYKFAGYTFVMQNSRIFLVLSWVSRSSPVSEIVRLTFLSQPVVKRSNKMLTINIGYFISRLTSAKFDNEISKYLCTMTRKLFLIFCALVSSLATAAQLHYVCYYVTQKPVIDGQGDDTVWQRAPWTEDFVDIEGGIRPAPPLQTRVKMLWDSTYLFIYAELREPDLWGTLRQHDTSIFDDNDFEVFINPDNTTHRYFEFEINTLGTEMDLFLDKPYRNGGKALLSWDARGLISAVAAKGTINQPGDADTGWSVEMAVPLKSLHFWGDPLPQNGTQWRINFSRVEWDRMVKDGVYQVKKDPATGRRLPEHNWVWSPQGAINMHMPEKWGYLQFSTHAGGQDTEAFHHPSDSAAREKLWMIYEQQRKFFRRHGHYAGMLSQLDVVGGSAVKMQTTDTQFTAVINGPDGPLSIDQDGEIRNPD